MSYGSKRKKPCAWGGGGAQSLELCMSFIAGSSIWPFVLMGEGFVGSCSMVMGGGRAQG